MPLSAGIRLGPYEILAPLGAGGMGEVYRAKDTRLDRTVALKVLPSELSANPALRERLEREAKAISSLAHPHICTLHDVGQDDGVDYLVMEYLEGETLAERLQKGPLPLEQALKCGIETAEALDAAHRQGVVHRDLKPGNVMLTKSGAKLLDFGLAKLREGDPSDPATSASAIPTEHRPLTEIGTILGTYPYMAPEQLEGKDIDGRADLFAFGAMLHEMVTGRRAFDGESRASLIAAIMEREPPPVSTLQPLSPPGLDHVVKTCLAKDPDERWQSAKDLASALRWIGEAGSQAGVAAPVVRRRRTRERITWSVAAVAVLALGMAIGWGWKDASQETPGVVRTTLLPPDGTRFDPRGGATVLSPDGTRVVFRARDEEGTRMLWVRSLDSLDAQPLTPGSLPFWSPDGRFIGFFHRRKLYKINLSGGPPQALCDTAGGGNERGGAWGADGTILFSPSRWDVIYRVSASGGTAVPVTAFDESRGERSHRFPQFLPDGKRFIFSVMAAIETPDTDGGLSIFAASLDSTEKTSIVATRSSARYASSGHLLFLRDRVLVAQAFDPGTLELSGDAVPVAENMSPSGRRQTMVSVSETGRLLFQPGFSAEERRLIWLDREGQELGTVGRPAVYYGPVLSHDQTRIAVEIWDREAQQSDLFVLNSERGTRTRLTFNPAIDRGPRWSADDKTLYFSSDRAGQRAVYSKSSSGAGTSALVYSGEGSVQLSSLSLDGKTAWITSGSLTGPTDRDILRVDLESREAEVFLQTPSREQWAAISPDGRWLLHQSDGHVIVQSLMGDRGKWQISTDVGALARWTRGGKEIVFRGREGTLMAAAVTLEPAFSAGTPEVLFDPGVVMFNQWDVTPDGNRFLVVQPIEQFGAEPLTLVQNWTNELER